MVESDGKLNTRFQQEGTEEAEAEDRGWNRQNDTGFMSD
jgi:hypothetical protein